MEGVTLYTECEYVRALPLDWRRGGCSSVDQTRLKWHGGQQGVKFATFMKAIKRHRPPPVPVGLTKASLKWLACGESDSFRFPPLSIPPEVLAGKAWRCSALLDASERELLMGFGPGHTDACQAPVLRSGVWWITKTSGSHCAGIALRSCRLR